MYGGGGSPSSRPLPEDSPLVSCGRAAFVAAKAADAAGGREADSSKGGAGANAVIDSQTVPVTAALMLKLDSGGK